MIVTALQEKLKADAETIRQIKEEINTHWEMYTELLKDDYVSERIDRIVDQLFNIIECYQSLIQGGNGEVEEKARNAKKESVKAGCEVLRPILMSVMQRADGMTILPTVGSMTEVVRLKGKADEMTRNGFRLAESDDFEGFNAFKNAIILYKDVERSATSIVAGHQRATEMAVGQGNRQKWQIALTCLALMVALGGFCLTVFWHFAG